VTLGAKLLGGRYRLGEVLGQGGMAIVYRAEDTELGRTVAIKVLREQFSADPEFLERFRREARAAAGLGAHPNIVGVYDVGREGSSNFIVMEYVDGVDLKELIRRDGPLPPERLVRLGCQLAAALEYAHRRGLVHRDVKSQNVLVTRDDQLKVSDFGIAVALGARSITEAGMVIGSVHYMAPEQAQGHPSTAATDVYALGVVLYEMATGRLPFEADSPLAVARMHIDSQPTPPHRVNPRLPVPISNVIMTTLAKEPGHRFPSAAEVAAALRGQRSRAAQRTSMVGRSPAPDAGTRPTSELAAVKTVPWTAIEAGTPGSHAPPRRAARAGRIGFRSFMLLALLLGLVGASIGWFLSSPPAIVSPRPTPAPVVVASPASNPTPAPAPTAVSPATPTPVPPSSTPLPSPTATSRPAPTATPAAARVQVPGVVGRPQAEAERTLQQAGFGADVKDDPAGANGLVVAQSPPPGTQLDQGRTVTITVGRAQPSPKTGVRVPNVEGMDERQARKTLEDAGFKVVVEEQVAPGRKGQVINQKPGAGDTVPPGATVTITMGV